MNLLIVAYYFRPYCGVGAKRVSYWAENIESEYDEEISLTVITATKPDIETQSRFSNLVFVPDTEKSLWKIFFSKDKGITWVRDLKQYVSCSNLPTFDIVLFTGGPFLHFGLSRFFKSRFKSKIVLDFRDPFATNPLFRGQFFKVWIKKYLEKKYISQADRVITVNKYCAELLSKRSGLSIDIIDNGFDERLMSDIRSKNSEAGSKENIQIVYAGKLSHGRDITEFLEHVTKNPHIIFHYVGSDYQEFENITNIISYGELPYKDTLEVISKCDVGLVLTGGNAFESTTKIFDYIGLGLKILVVSQKPFLKQSSISDILREYPNYVIHNQGIDNFSNLFRELSKQSLPYKADLGIFSRKNGLKMLINLLNEVKWS